MSHPHQYSAEVLRVLEELEVGTAPERTTLRNVVRELLGVLAARAPGRSVEVRVPPFGAIQCIEGPRHTRGTPPNVIETDPITWVQLATGRKAWADAMREGKIHASGVRADLSDYVPL